MKKERNGDNVYKFSWVQQTRNEDVLRRKGGKKERNVSDFLVLSSGGWWWKFEKKGYKRDILKIYKSSS